MKTLNISNETVEKIDGKFLNKREWEEEFEDKFIGLHYEIDWNYQNCAGECLLKNNCAETVKAFIRQVEAQAERRGRVEGGEAVVEAIKKVETDDWNGCYDERCKDRTCNLCVIWKGIADKEKCKRDIAANQALDKLKNPNNEPLTEE